MIFSITLITLMEEVHLQIRYLFIFSSILLYYLTLKKYLTGIYIVINASISILKNNSVTKFLHITYITVLFIE